MDFLSYICQYPNSIFIRELSTSKTNVACPLESYTEYYAVLSSILELD
jgi:hypothetical protein